MQKCATGGDDSENNDDNDFDFFIILVFIRAKELETVLNNEEQGMVVPITR